MILSNQLFKNILFLITIFCLACNHNKKKIFNIPRLSINTNKQSGNNINDKNKVLENSKNINSTSKHSIIDLINSRDDLLFHIKKKYKKEVQKPIKGTTGIATLYSILWILNLINNDILKSNNSTLDILKQLKNITLNLKNVQEKNPDNISWQINLDNLELDFVKNYDKKINNLKNLTAFFKNVKSKLKTDLMQKEIKIIEQTIYKIDKFKKSPPPNISTITNIKYNLVTNYTTALLLLQGGLVPSKTGWWLTENFLKDRSGALMYHKGKQEYKTPIIDVNFLGRTFHFVTDLNYVKQILDQSPDVFDAGEFKRKFSASFMPRNVASSSAKTWYNRRYLNDNTLYPKSLHPYGAVFNDYIIDELNKKIPKNYSEFDQVGKRITSQVVFGKNQYAPNDFFEVFKLASNPTFLLKKDFKIDEEVNKKYINYMNKHVKNPQKGSLVNIAMNIKNKYCPYLSKLKCEKNWENEVKGQIPHFIFPTVMTFNSIIPRLLLLLTTFPKKLQKLKKEINEIDTKNHVSIYNMKYLRKCILETSRLNAITTTLLRTSTKEYSFDNKGQYKYPKGSHFLILSNPVHRESEKFYSPNEFIPERWNDELENSYYNLIFGRGPQICPGKELAIFLQQSFIVHYLKKINFKLYSKTKLNKKFIDLMINPLTITFE